MHQTIVVAIAVTFLLVAGCAPFPKGDCEAGSLAVYGNWCGPKHPKTGACPPVNWVDEACRKHDECYAEKGYFNCDCDLQLQKTLSEGSSIREPIDRKHTFLWLGEKSPFPQRREVMQLYFKHSKCRNGD